MILFFTLDTEVYPKSTARPWPCQRSHACAEKATSYPALQWCQLPSKAVRLRFPNSIESPFRGIRLTCGNSPDDLIVLFHRGSQFVEYCASVEPPVAFRLRLRRFMQLQQPRSRACGHDFAVETHIQVEYAVWIPASRLRQISEPFVEFLQPPDQFVPLGGRQLSSESCAQSFNVPNNGIEFLCILLCQRATVIRLLAPLPEAITYPSRWSQCKAPRTGVRLYPRRSARSASMIQVPGDNFPLTIISRISWKTDSCCSRVGRHPVCLL